MRVKFAWWEGPTLRIKPKNKPWWAFFLFQFSIKMRAISLLTWHWEGEEREGIFMLIIPGPNTANKLTLLLFGIQFGGGLKNG